MACSTRLLLLWAEEDQDVCNISLRCDDARARRRLRRGNRRGIHSLKSNGRNRMGSRSTLRRSHHRWPIIKQYFWITLNFVAIHAILNATAVLLDRASAANAPHPRQMQIVGWMLVLSQYEWPRFFETTKYAIEKIKSEGSFTYPNMLDFIYEGGVIEELAWLLNQVILQTNKERHEFLEGHLNSVILLIPSKKPEFYVENWFYSG